MIIIHVTNDPPYLPRYLEPVLEEVLQTFPVVVISGARQTGKSTLARHLGEGSGRAFQTLDDIEILERAQTDPEALVRSAPLLTLDEVQRSPDLLLAIKRAVDEDRVPGRFLLTGSANLLLMRRVSESLAGRAVHLNLWPMSRSEQEGRGQCGIWTELFENPEQDWLSLIRGQPARPGDWKSMVQRGGYPVACRLDSAQQRSLWLAGYTQTYLERDLQELSAIGSLVGFRRLMRAACLRLGNIINQTELGRDVGLSQPTVGRHLSLLETSFQLVPVEAYSVNRTKRLIKSPKFYWSDPALALHLAGESEARGAHLENLVLLELLVWRSAWINVPQILYWRTADGKEIDFVIEWKGRLLPIEVKATSRPRAAQSKNLQIFRQEYKDRSLPGLLLHAGEETTWLASGILAAPWWRVF